MNKHTLDGLINKLGKYKLSGNHKVEVKGIVDDSRKVRNGSLFVAINGLHFDAHEFIPDVINKGASVVVGEKHPEEKWLDRISYIQVPNSRKALSLLASAWYYHPSEKMKIVGATGTDGKTTVVNIIQWVLANSGKKVGMVSTVDIKIGDKIFDSGSHVSNPEPLELQKLMKQMVDAGCKYAVLEVTSHGLDQERVTGIDFDMSVLTNISPEHLDYHKNMNNYYKAKSRLFEYSKLSLLNRDDESFNKMNSLLIGKTKINDYSVSKLSPETKKLLQGKYPEKFNQENVAAAVSVLKILGIEDVDIIKGLSNFPGVSGRMEKVENSRKLSIYIDFAHTPKAVKNVLSNFSKKKGRLLAIVSSEGERDPSKRAKIARIAIKYADLTILNPIDSRSENPEDILEEMEKGAKEAGGVKFENETSSFKTHSFRGLLDRNKAIRLAINNYSKPGDTIAILGKGHEKSMAVSGKEIPWSDKKATIQALKNSL